MSDWKKLNFSLINSKDPQSSLETDLSIYINIDRKHLLRGSKYNPLRHSEQGRAISEFLKVNSKNGMDITKLRFPPGESAFYNQLKILVYKMVAFKRFQDMKLIKSEEGLEEILLGTLKGGFNYNSAYKKKLEDKTRAYLRGETDVVYQEFPDYHLIPWLDEEDIDKIYVFTDPLPIDERKLNRVMDEMDRNIVDDAFIRDIDLIDALYLVNQKKMNHLDEKGRTKTSFECRGSELDISFPDNGLSYLFKKVTTNPSTSRAAGLPTVKTRNLVYAAHSNLDKVTLSNNDLYKSGLEPGKWIEKLSKGEDKYFIMIDFKKSGLTTNRRVIKSVYETALKHYPGFRPWVQYLKSLDYIEVNGMESKRGTSLGMDDNALSFFLSCAFKVWRESHPYGKYVEGYFKGDDQILICDCSEDIVREIFRSWIKDLKKLGLLINAKKSFIGVRGQFCEIVGMGSGIDTKIIGYSLNCFDALGTYNMVDFKIFINNLKKIHDLSRYSKIFDLCLSTTIHSVEPEFCYDEIEAPFEMGGYFSNYDHGLNTFIVDIFGKYKEKFDRRLYNVIGWERPIMSYEYRKALKLLDSPFEDTKSLISKLRKFSCKPMSKSWKKSYDDCLKARLERFKGTITLIGANVQKLIDSKESYALPVEYLVRNETKERTFVPMKKFKGKARTTMINHFNLTRKDMILKATKTFYLIDDIRARELLLSARTGQNEFLINYYSKVPCSTLIWSICKYITNSEWAIPLNWAEYANRTRVSLDKLWRYYGAQGIHLYDYRPKTIDEPTVTKMFRGPSNVLTDTLIMCPYSGFPLKFSSWDFRAFVENYCHGHWDKSKRFFMDLSEAFYPEWQDEIHKEAWWGPSGRNKPIKKEWFVKTVMESAGIYSIETYMQKIRFEEHINLIDIPIENTEINEEEEIVNFDDEEEQHYSDSDVLEEYFKDNPLKSGSDDEEDPYRDYSESDTET